MVSHPLRDYIGYRIIQVLRAHRSHADPAFNALGLHPGQEWILFQLWNEEGLTQSQLTDVLHVEPPTVSKALQRLEQAGFVERRQDPEDARVSRVYLTQHGRAIQVPVQKIWDDLEALTVKGLSDVEKALLRRLLEHIYNNLAE